MTFYTVYKEQPYEGYCRNNTFLAAKTIILKYPFGAAETILDKYCIEHYRLPLRYLCLKVLFSLRAMSDKDGKIVWKTPTEKYDKIARLITYGDGIMQGSQILRTALLQNVRR